MPHLRAIEITGIADDVCEMLAWSADQCGDGNATVRLTVEDDLTTVYPVFFFREERDAMYFKLRWL